MKKVIIISLTLPILFFTATSQADCNHVGADGRSVDENGQYCGTCGTNCNWVIQDDTLKVTGGADGTIGHMDAGSGYVDGVFTFSQPWQGLKSEFSKVDISGVDNVGQDMFGRDGYTNIKEVYIGDSVTSIGPYAFAGTSITSITLPDSLQTLGYRSFSNGDSQSPTSIEQVIIPDSVTSIGNSAFGANVEQLQNLKILCKGNQSNCASVLAGYTYWADEMIPLSLSGNVSPATSKNCESTDFYWTGKECVREPDQLKRQCCSECRNAGQGCRRISYTVNEAAIVSKPTGNKFMLRYK